MNPDANMNLPPPISEAPQPAAAQELLNVPTPEQPAARPEAAGTRPATAQPPITPPVDNTQLPPPAADDQTTAAPTATTDDSATSPAASDSDKIEKEWVMKAKHIVDATSDNPFEQNKQLAYVKADYLQRRYGKVVKLAE